MQVKRTSMGGETVTVEVPEGWKGPTEVDQQETLERANIQPVEQTLEEYVLLALSGVRMWRMDEVVTSVCKLIREKGRGEDGERREIGVFRARSEGRKI